MKTPVWILFPAVIGMLVSYSEIFAVEGEITIPVSAEADITVQRFPSSGKYLMLMLAPEYGFRDAHRTLARKLAKKNVEVWMTNIVESLFLTQGTGSIKELDGKYVAGVIEYAYKKTGKKIIVSGDSYAAISALRGAHQWQQKKRPISYMIGAVLFSPYTYAYIPPLGMPPEYMPIVSTTNIPIMIFQSEKSGTINQFKYLVEILQQHGSPVYTKIIPDVMSLFYEQPPTAAMKKNLNQMSGNIKNMIAILEKHKVPAKPIAIYKEVNNKSGIDITLKDYKGNKTPTAINLKDIYGNTVIKDDFKGKVTLVNFWATWCTPCILEIPSLNRLKNKMAGLPFELISINYAEDKNTILDFMKEVNVEFPVLLDKNGDFAKKYKVIVYPSTFVIDKNGKIRYGVNAAIDWDDPELIQILKSLL